MKEAVFILAERYAKALIGLAVEADAIDVVGQQLTALAGACLGEAKAQAFWRSLKVPEDEKRHTLQDVLEKMDAHGLVRNTANLMLDRGRFGLLPELARAFRRQARELSQTIDVEVTTAAELDEAMQERLCDGLKRRTGRSITLRVVVDPALLGGVRVRIGNTVIDGSARGRLRAFARSLT